MTSTRTQPSDVAQAILLAMSYRLTAVRPTHVMQDPIRLAMVLTYATEHHGYLSDAAAELEAEVLQYAPPVDREITRGEYALILRRAAGGDDQ
ncbi:hypothetical protein [Streptomyces sp. NPDC058280]|uniref:hypothetical protein n=1 Tax=Streptomyces sp. NPDC058280 TaxID=3346419 RepID=UPI0036EC596E